MKYCERWEKLNRETGELTPISCKSWTCPKCRPAMEKALERKIIVARPTHFLTISWQIPPGGTTWQKYLRAERKLGTCEAVTVFTPGHLHAITRSTNPPNRELIKKFFDCQVVVEVFRPSHISYCTAHLGKGNARQRATTNFYRRVSLSPRRRPRESEEIFSDGISEAIPSEKSGAVEDGKSGAVEDGKSPPPILKPKRSDMEIVIGQLETIINLLEGRKNPKIPRKKTEGFF